MKESSAAAAGQSRSSSNGEALSKSLEGEQAAFQQQLGKLLKDLPGKFVALLDGKVIDQDADEVSLVLRISRQGLEKPVLVCQVSENSGYEALEESLEKTF